MRQDLRHSRITLAAVMIASAFLCILRFDSFQVGAFSDDAHYIVLAESLASGQGYRLISYPDAPAEWAFPPGWPMLLSVIVSLFPRNYEALKGLSLVLWLASIPLLYGLLSKRIEAPYSDILVALVALNPNMIGISGMVMSEAAYLFFSLLAFCLYEEWNRNQDKAWAWVFFIMLATAAVYAQLIRTVGLSILLAIIVYSLFRRRFRQTAFIVAILLLGMLPQFWLYSRNGGALISHGYQVQVFNNSVKEKVVQVWANMRSYSDEMIASSLVPIFGPNVSSALESNGIGFVLPAANVLILLFVMVGMLRAVRKTHISDVYVVFFFVGILLFWNPKVGSAQSRFLIPIIPFLFFYFLQGSTLFLHLFLKTDKRVFRGAVTIASVIVLISLARNLQDWQNPIRNRITDLELGTTWIYENTPLDAVVMARDPVPDYLYARRKTVSYPTQEQDIDEYIRTNDIDYILIAPRLQTPRSNDLGEYVDNHLLPVLTSNQDVFTAVYTDTANNVAVFEYRGRP